MIMKMKNRSHGHDINSHKYDNYQYDDAYMH